MGITRGSFERVSVGDVWRPNQIAPAVAHIDPGSVLNNAASTYARVARYEGQKAGVIADAVKGAVNTVGNAVKAYIGVKAAQKNDAAQAANEYREYKSRLDTGQEAVNSQSMEHLATLKNAMDGKMAKAHSWNPFGSAKYSRGTMADGYAIMGIEGSDAAFDGMNTNKDAEAAFEALAERTRKNAEKDKEKGGVRYVDVPNDETNEEAM